MLPPAWLIKQILPAGEVSMVYGPSDSGKTWLLVDIAKRVAQHYPVLYVAAEDAAGIRVRKQAWEQHYRSPRNGNFLMIPMPVPLADPANVAELIRQTRGKGYALIVIDTLSQCIAGVNENDNGEMSLVLRHLQEIAHQTGAAVVVLHHSTKDGANFRGASVLKNNTYGLLEVSRDDDVILLECGRIKNSRPFAPRRFKLVEVVTGLYDDEGLPITSCVLKPARQVVQTGDHLTANQRKLLEALALMTEATDGARTSDLVEVTGLRGNSFYSALRRLRALGYVRKDGATRLAPLVIADAGRAWLARHAEGDQPATDEAGGAAPLFDVNPRLTPAPRSLGGGAAGAGSKIYQEGSSEYQAGSDGSNVAATLATPTTSVPTSSTERSNAASTPAAAASSATASQVASTPLPHSDAFAPATAGSTTADTPTTSNTCSQVAPTPLPHSDAVANGGYQVTLSATSTLDNAATTTLSPLGESGGSTNQEVEVHELESQAADEPAPSQCDQVLAEGALASLDYGAVDLAYKQAAQIAHETLRCVTLVGLAARVHPRAITDADLRAKILVMVGCADDE